MTTSRGAARTHWLGLALLALISVILATACGDDDAGDGESPASPSTTASEDSTVDRLRANAAAFEYRAGKHGGTLTFATISDPLTFNLAISNDASSSGVLGYLFEGLTEVSWLTNEVEPALAESWENSADGLTWIFRLQRNVQWHDGTPLTAQDVEFTFNRIIYNDDIPASVRPAFTFRFLNEAGGWQEARMLVETIDDHTVRFVLPVPFAPFLRTMGAAIFPKHLLEQAVDDGVFAETWGLDTNPGEIVGTGPFTIESYAPAERVVLKRNPNYWLSDDEGERLPYLDSIVQVIVPDLEAELESFRSGESDIYGVPGKEFAALEPLQEEENFTIYRRGPDFGTTFLAFNMNAGVNPETGEPYVAPEKLAWFRNTEFRRAVSYAIDREAIIEKAFDGLGYPQWASISPAAGDFHNPEVRRFPHDPDKAKSILDSLGWRDRGRRRRARGRARQPDRIPDGDQQATTPCALRCLPSSTMTSKPSASAPNSSSGSSARSWDSWYPPTTGRRSSSGSRAVRNRTAASASGTAARRSISGIRTRRRPQQSGKRRSTGSTSRGARSWTGRNGSGSTNARRRSRRRTYRSSTPSCRSG